MKVPKTFITDKDLKNKLEELLDKEKVNVIIVKEERMLISLYCRSIEGEVLLQLNDEGVPEKMLGCESYNEDTGYCRNKGFGCNYLRWKKLKECKK